MHLNSALFYTDVHKVEIRPVSGVDRLIAGFDGDCVGVRTLWSGISRGTERLVCGGRVPPSEWARMRAPFQEGDFPFPVKYGYAAVGRVEQGPSAWLGRRVFALHPHQQAFAAPLAAATPVPDAVPSRRATLAANMETALNAVWDAGVAPGDRLAVVGAGVVGCLIAGLCAGLPGAAVTMIDIAPERAAAAKAMSAAFAEPGALGDDHGADCVIHASASEAGLAEALRLAGFEATVLEASWYGDAAPRVPLGAAFHAKRLRLASTQVGHVAPSRRPRWSRERRLATALSLLADRRYDALLTDEIAFEDAPTALPAFLAPGAPGLAGVLRYAGAEEEAVAAAG